jgi:beta-galactosidase
VSGATASELLRAAQVAHVAPVVTEAPEFVEATRRAGERASFLFVLNRSDTSPATLEVEPGGIDLITGNSVDGPLELPPLGVAVVEYHSAQPAAFARHSSRSRRAASLGWRSRVKTPLKLRDCGR